MNRAVCLVDVSISTAPETPAPVSTLYPTLGYSMRPSMRSSTSPSLRPTLAPSPRATLLPALSGAFATEPPATQRSATLHPRFDAAARYEATNLLAGMRLNLDFLQSLLHGQASLLAVTAVAELHQTIDRLERRLGACPSAA